jgi:hypothetical protein
MSRPDDLLERRLEEIARRLELPPDPSLAPAIGAHLRRRPRRAPWSALLRAPRSLAMAGAALLLLGGGLVALPGVRTAVAGWLGIPGVRIEAEPGRRPPGIARAELDIGRRVSLEEAAAAVPFEVLEPTLAGLGAPDSVFLDERFESGRVTLVYDAGARLPRAAETGVGLLLTEFEATLDEDLVKKLTFEGTVVEPVAIGDDRGYWLGGEPHVILYGRPGGDVLSDTVRLAGNTLVWQHDGLTLRLESALGKRQALRVARSVR